MSFYKDRILYYDIQNLINSVISHINCTPPFIKEKNKLIWVEDNIILTRKYPNTENEYYKLTIGIPTDKNINTNKYTSYSFLDFSHSLKEEQQNMLSSIFYSWGNNE